MKVTIDYIAKCVSEVVGRDAVRIKTAHHLQIRSGNGWHNVYVSKGGLMKIVRSGCARSQQLKSVESLLEIAAEKRPAQTDVQKAREAVDLAVFIGWTRKALPKGLQEAVFVDAGWKDGIAQIAAVHVERWPNGVAVQAVSYPFAIETPSSAERRAIRDGLNLAGEAVVFSDCESVVNEFRKEFGNQVRWLARDRNKVADKLGNRRAKGASA